MLGCHFFIFRVTEEGVNATEKNLGEEKPVGEVDAADGNKDTPANETEEKEPEEKVSYQSSWPPSPAARKYILKWLSGLFVVVVGQLMLFVQILKAYGIQIHYPVPLMRFIMVLIKKK